MPAPPPHLVSEFVEATRAVYRLRVASEESEVRATLVALLEQTFRLGCQHGFESESLKELGADLVYWNASRLHQLVRFLHRSTLNHDQALARWVGHCRLRSGLQFLFDCVAHGEEDFPGVGEGTQIVQTLAEHDTAFRAALGLLARQLRRAPERPGISTGESAALAPAVPPSHLWWQGLREAVTSAGANPG